MVTVGVADAIGGSVASVELQPKDNKTNIRRIGNTL